VARLQGPSAQRHPQPGLNGLVLLRFARGAVAEGERRSSGLQSGPINTNWIELKLSKVSAVCRTLLKQSQAQSQSTGFNTQKLVC
jgi:hypothetical protein